MTCKLLSYMCNEFSSLMCIILHAAYLLDLRVLHNSAGQRICEDMTTLELMARHSGFVVTDVPRGGNCLFTAVQVQLQKLGIKHGEDTLRQQLVTYLETHPFTHGTFQFREFISAPIVSTDSTVLTLSCPAIRMNTSVPLRMKAHGQSYNGSSILKGYPYYINNEPQHGTGNNIPPHFYRQCAS